MSLSPFWLQSQKLRASRRSLGLCHEEQQLPSRRLQEQRQAKGAGCSPHILGSTGHVGTQAIVEECLWLSRFPVSFDYEAEITVNSCFGCCWWVFPRDNPKVQFSFDQGFPGGSWVKNPPPLAGDVGLIPGSGRSPEEGNSNPLQYSARRITCTEKPGGLKSMGSQRVGHETEWLTLKITVKDSKFQPGAISCKHELEMLENNIIP